jgi:hypothetical protein
MGMGNWRAEMQDVAAAIDDEFGEAFMILPMLPNANKVATPDPGIEAFQAIGVFSWRAAMARQGGTNQLFEPALISRKPIASFSAKCLPCSLRRQWRIQRLEFGDELFEITGVFPDGVSRVDCHLTQLGRSTQ